MGQELAELELLPPYQGEELNRMGQHAALSNEVGFSDDDGFHHVLQLLQLQVIIFRLMTVSQVWAAHIPEILGEETVTDL